MFDIILLTHTGFEPVLLPWKGKVLTTRRMGLIKPCQERRGSNPQPLVLETKTLPIELLSL